MASSSARHKTVHHLSQKAAAETFAAENGWIESIAGLAENSSATALLRDPDKYSVAPKLAANGHGLVGMSSEEQFRATLDQSLLQLRGEVESMGEALLVVGAPNGWGPHPLTSEQMEGVLKEVTPEMEGVGADVTELRRRAGTSTVKGEIVDVLVRRRGTSTPLEIRVAIIGNVDSGKSTMVGVLTRSMLDDGRGLARSKVFKHGHEELTGRTSSIGQHNLCLNSRGEILNDSMFRSASSADYILRAAKVVTLVDLAGHERYFKTTAYGLTGHLPDYACLIVSANNGIVGMCKEHLGVALALKVPVFFIVTKVDICPDHILKETLSKLNAILKKPGVKKRPFMVRTVDDTLTCARHMHTDSLAPIFLTSSVTGDGLDLIRLFYSVLPSRIKWSEKASKPVEFIIDETFGVPGVGTVVAGTLKQGVIGTNSTLLLGPSPVDGSFHKTAIKSIHYKRLPVPTVVAGQTAALALKKVKRNLVRKGMVLVGDACHPEATWEFDADIAILTHSTTIQPRYQAVIHCEIVRQAARVIAMNSELLRSGDRACVRFRFLQRPEYLTPGTRFVFREGRTKGIGMVVKRTDSIPLEPVAEKEA